MKTPLNAVDASRANLNASVEKWSAVALEKGWAGQWVEGAILPTEMVFFLARCDAAGVTRVVESGRQDGYSTLILGEYITRRPEIEAWSIDFEDDAERARRCRERLKPFPALKLLSGNSNMHIPAIFRDDPGRPTAFLVDGPKEFWALSLMVAAIGHPGVRIVSLHNLSPGVPYRTYFESLGGNHLFLETHGFDSDPWRALQRAERVRLDAVSPGRSAESSTLGLLEVTDAVRRRAAWAFDGHFHFFQPPLVRIGWSLGLDRLVNALYTVSFKIWDR